jgi:hypothetical protein
VASLKNRSTIDENPTDLKYCLMGTVVANNLDESITN